MSQAPRGISPEVLFLAQQIQPLPIESRAFLLFQGLALRPELVRQQVIQQALREVIDQAPQAKHPLPTNFAVESDIDSLESQGARAIRTKKLDALDIRVQAIAWLSTAHVPTYKLAAATVPVISFASCKDPEVPSYDPITSLYEQNVSIWLAAHETTETELHDDIAGRIGRSGSIVALTSVASLLGTLPLSKDDIFDLSYRLVRQSHQLNVSSRELGSLLQDGHIIAAFSQLATRLEAGGYNSREIISALKEILITGARNRCQDSTYKPGLAAASFNTMVGGHPAYVADIHLREADLAGGHTEASVQLHSIDPTGTDDVAIQTLARYATRADKGLHVEDMAGWEDESASLLHALQYQSATNECPSCFLFRTCFKYFLLADYSPDQGGSQAKRRAYDAYTRFLVESPVKTEDPALWIYQLEMPLGLSRKADELSIKKIDEYHAKGFHLVGLPSASADVVVQDMSMSRDATVHAFALAEKLFRPQYHAPF